jgi:hypothetical protein
VPFLLSITKEREVKIKANNKNASKTLYPFLKKKEP